MRTVGPGDTARALAKGRGCKDRGPEKPGIADIRTLGVNQDGSVVLQYERKVMVWHRGDKPAASEPQTGSPEFPWVDDPQVELPVTALDVSPELTGPNTYFEDFKPGDVIVHANGRTITDEHVQWTYGVGNTHPLHYDRVYSMGISGAMSGEPIVYGGLVFAWLEGLASRDVTENAVWELGFTEGYHTQPAVSGDTVFPLTRILAADDGPDGTGIVTMQLVGVKNISAAKALDEFGEDLFTKENAKKKAGKEKIPAKIFEIERRVLLKKRP